MSFLFYNNISRIVSGSLSESMREGLKLKNICIHIQSESNNSLHVNVLLIGHGLTSIPLSFPCRDEV